MVERVDPLLRLRRGLALPLCWGLIAVLISLFLPNLFARSTDPTAMLNERVYQLKPVVRSTRGLIFSPRNESGPRTQVSRQLETPGPQREITGTHRIMAGRLSSSAHCSLRCWDTWCLVLFSQRAAAEKITWMKSQGSLSGADSLDVRTWNYRLQNCKLFFLQTDGDSQSYILILVAVSTFSEVVFSLCFLRLSAHNLVHICYCNVNILLVIFGATSIVPGFVWLIIWKRNIRVVL